MGSANVTVVMGLGGEEHDANMDYCWRLGSSRRCQTRWRLTRDIVSLSFKSKLAKLGMRQPF